MIPKELYEEIKKGDCVLFAGAGISTEGGIYGKPSFYENILSKCKLERKKNLSFPDLMQEYCNKYDGGRKNRLIREIIERIELFSGYGEIYNSTTMFHSYVAKIPTFKIIVTTNWDTFFERELNVLVPLVEDLDVPFWDDKKRQILKIHGSITSPHTIISTRSDYKNLIKNHSKKPIFNKLKDLIATKTFLFVGYSMRDENIQLIYDTLLKKLGSFARTSYAIDPNSEKRIIDNWGKRGIKIINESPISFMRELIKNLAKEGIIPNPNLLEHYSKQHKKIIDIHLSHNQDKDFLSAMYQDGLLHSFQEIFNSCEYGTLTMDELKIHLKEYSKNKGTFIRKKDPIEFAYWSGRFKVLKSFLEKKEKEINPYFKGKELNLLKKRLKTKKS